MRGRLILRYSRIALNKNILDDKEMSIIKYLKSSSKRKKTVVPTYKKKIS